MKIHDLYLPNVYSTESPAPCIEVFKSIWPDVDSTINSIEKEISKEESSVHWQKASTFGGGEFQDMRTNKTFNLTYAANVSPFNAFADTHNQFYTLLLSSLAFYKAKYDIHENLFFEDFVFLRYSGGEHYDAHYDGTTSIGRAVSAILYLNDDYSGGELEFPYQNIKIKPEKGTLIIFPSNYAYAHIAHEVLTGSKYAIVTWIHDRPL